MVSTGAGMVSPHPCTEWRSRRAGVGAGSTREQYRRIKGESNPQAVLSIEGDSAVVLVPIRIRNLKLTRFEAVCRIILNRLVECVFRVHGRVAGIQVEVAVESGAARLGNGANHDRALGVVGRIVRSQD